MTVPNAEQAEIPPDKITHYLLNLEHEDGGPKAKFFLGWGFRPDDWEVMAQSLRDQITNHPFLDQKATPFGTKYTVVAPLSAPNGTTPEIKSVWIVLEGKDQPKLVTAYPVD